MKKITLLCQLNKSFSLIIFSLILSFSSSIFAQGLPDEQREQRETRISDRADKEEKPKTADEILEMLKERAMLKIKERRRQLLLKTRVSAGTTFGYESNPLNDSFEKGDSFAEENFSFDWVPTFSQSLSADLGYSLTNQDYFDQETLGTMDHSLTAALKYYPFSSGKLLLEPGAGYTWLLYPLDSSSQYEQAKYFLKYTHYIAKKWNYGGKYEFSEKTYDKKTARDDDQNNLNFHREDRRHSSEIWVKYYIGKYSLKLKEKSYINTSNDEYQDYNDYDAHHGYVTLSSSFLKDNRLSLSVTSDFEVKNYWDRVAVTTARSDRVIQHAVNAYYTWIKPFTLSYSLTFKESSSNIASGEFTDVTNKFGVTADF